LTTLLKKRWEKNKCAAKRHCCAKAAVGRPTHEFEEKASTMNKQIKQTNRIANHN